MSTKQKDKEIKAKALSAVIKKLTKEQETLRWSVKDRKFKMHQLSDKQTQEKREIAELGKLIRGLHDGEED